MISASTLRSDNSSRSLCASIRKFSRSCSPILISSSIITDLSMATLYLDSRSSSDEVVFRACLSKSSLATSISRSRSWSARFVSLRVVISFSKVFCAELASAFAFRYFSWRKRGQHLPTHLFVLSPMRRDGDKFKLGFARGCLPPYLPFVYLKL